MPTPDVIQEMKQTCDTIEKGLQDLKANAALKSEVVTLIDERVKNDKDALAAAQAKLTEQGTHIDELEAANAEIQRKVGGMKSTPELFGRDGQYTGLLGSPRAAKAFALLTMLGSMSGSSRMKGRCDRVKKSLDEMGIDPMYVDSKGHILDKAMETGSPTGGGVLVGQEVIPQIQMMLNQFGVFRRYARNIPMGAGETLMPSCSDLLTMDFPGEGSDIDTADPTIKLIKLIPKTGYLLTAYSSQLEEDALVALGEWLAEIFTRSAAYAEDYYGFLGDGTSTYKGFTGICGGLKNLSATIANIAGLIVGTGNLYSELVIGDFEKVAGILPDFADDGDAAWYAHRYFYYTVMVRIALAATGATATETIMNAGRRDKMFLEYPVRSANVMPKAEANSQVCAILGNLRMGAKLGVRGGLEFATSSERYFEKDLIAARCRDRFAINVQDGIGNASGTASARVQGPIVGLITAAS